MITSKEMSRIENQLYKKSKKDCYVLNWFLKSATALFILLSACQSNPLIGIWEHIEKKSDNDMTLLQLHIQRDSYTEIYSEFVNQRCTYKSIIRGNYTTETYHKENSSTDTDIENNDAENNDAENNATDKKKLIIEITSVLENKENDCSQFVTSTDEFLQLNPIEDTYYFDNNGKTLIRTYFKGTPYEKEKRFERKVTSSFP